MNESNIKVNIKSNRANIKWLKLISLFLSIFTSFLASFQVQASNNKCNSAFNGKSNNQQEVEFNFKSQVIDEKSILDISRISASWDLTKNGITEISTEVHGLDNVLYYTLVALLTRENILVDGPGGGAKTMVIRKAYEAQLRSVNKLSIEEKIKYLKDSSDAYKTLVDLIQKDKNETDPKRRIFTQQFHETLSETKVLGGPDPFKYTKDGEYEIDYKKALIHEQNMFAILDEIEKAPVALQMTLLSILNERQALVGNQVIHTMLESVAATTNATLGELIAQALPHEVGGRRAFIDRFGLKVHVVNVSKNALDSFIMLEKVKKSKVEKNFAIIDLRGLRPLLNEVKIPDEMLKAATQITLAMDRSYTEKLKEELEKVKGAPNLQAAFYPPFSGSTRVQSKVVKFWKAAFLARQLMQGVSFEDKSLIMQPKDLVDLAPALLQGGPELIVPEFRYKVHFIQTLPPNHFIKIVSSNIEKKSDVAYKYMWSEGFYDPHTQIFQFRSAKNNETIYLKFDPKNEKLISTRKDILREILHTPEEISMLALPEKSLLFVDLNKNLKRLHDKSQKPINKKGVSSYPFLTYKTDGTIDTMFVDAPLREGPRSQLQEIQKFHNDFVGVINHYIADLSEKKLTFSDHKDIKENIQLLENEAFELRRKLSLALKQNNKENIIDLAAESVRQAYKELSYLFIESSSTIEAEFASILNRKNLMIFGPPGSAKTMLTRIILDKEVEFLSEAQIAEANSILSEALVAASPGSKSIWVKQFHPMSNEGDIVGRIDLKKVRNKEGYAYNRKGSMSEKDILFALLDEFEKAPPGVRTALLSLLNERELMDGDEVIKSSIIAVVLATNSTPGEFIIGLGAFSTAFPIYDRVHLKAYALNKLESESLEEFHRRMYLNVNMKMQSPLLIHPLTELAKEYSLEHSEANMLVRIHQDFMKEVVNRSEAERKMWDPKDQPDFFMNTRGESSRSFVSSHLEELAGNVLLKKILAGAKPSELLANEFKFEPIDLIAFAQMYLPYNAMYSIGHEYDVNGTLKFVVKSKEVSVLQDRLDERELKTFENIQYETEQMVQRLNKYYESFMRDRAKAIAEFPLLYPSAFVSPEARVSWLKSMGYKEEEITKLVQKN